MMNIDKIKKMITEVYFPKLLEKHYGRYGSLRLQAYIGHTDCNSFSDDYFFLVMDDEIRKQYFLCFKHLKYVPEGSNMKANAIGMYTFDCDYYSEVSVSEDLKEVDWLNDEKK